MSRDAGLERRIIFLVAVIVVAFATLALSLNYLQTRDAASELPAELASRTIKPSQYGNLTQYELVVNCTLDGGLDSAPVFTYGNVTITLDEARAFARGAFGFDAPNYEESSADSVYLKQGKEALQFDGRNRITYSLLSYRTPTFGEWNEAWAVGIADDFLDRFEPCWDFDTDAERKLVGVEVDAYASPGDTENVTKLEVQYIWGVGGVDVLGTEGYVRIKADGAVVKAEAVKPAVTITGRQSVTVTPAQAVQSLIDGWDVNTIIGVPDEKAEKPVNGTLVIEGVEPVYYLAKTPDSRRVPILLYQIHAKIIYELEDGIHEIDIYDYQYAN